MAKAALNSLLLLICTSLWGAELVDNPLKKKIEMSAFSGTIAKAMRIISQKGDFYFSYNSSYINDDEQVELQSGTYQVESLLNTLFGKTVEYRVNGRHIILLPSRKAKEEEKPKRTAPEPKPRQYVIQGTVTNSLTGEKISEATVFESNKLLSTLTDNAGNYSIVVSSDEEVIPLAISKNAYYDTVIVVQPSTDLMLDLNLRPMAPATTEVPELDIKLESAKTEVNSVGLVQFVVPEEQIANSNNLGYELNRPAQISFLPFLGSNRSMSGNAINNVSVNILGGYSAGTQGVEVGGLVNINRIEMSGFQAAGIGNITGGQVNGAQLAGFFNHNRGSTRGFQAAGFHNITFDTMTGLQAAGFVNVLHGRMEGAQLAGFANVTTKNVDGLQMAGFANAAGGDVKLAQLAGFVNYGGNVGGGQLAGFCNFANGNVGGMQAAGFFNVANGNIGGCQMAGFLNLSHDVAMFQAAGAVNVSTGTINGLQIAGLINVAQNINGIQLAPFNFADSVSKKGTPIGIFSYANNGYHSMGIGANEYGLYNFTFKTGVNRFYNLFGFGLGVHELGLMYNLKYGLGTRGMITKWLGVNLEASTSQIQLAEGPISGVNMINSLDLNFEFVMLKHLSIAIGPAWRAQTFDTSALGIQPELAPYYLTSNVFGPTQTNSWIGGNLSLNVIF